MKLTKSKLIEWRETMAAYGITGRVKEIQAIIDAWEGP